MHPYSAQPPAGGALPPAGSAGPEGLSAAANAGGAPSLRPSSRRPVTLIVQIPCYNEEATLPETLAALPRRLPGVDRIEWLIVNDGSTDRTVEVARAHGVDHVVDMPVHVGLARGFMAGLHRAVEAGADIIVNTDADNQYDAADIPKLIAPILERRAELVIGDRPIDTIRHFSPLKRLLQHIGSAVVRFVSKTRVGDAPSGFRALSREAALRLTVFDPYTYTLETIIEAGLSDMQILSVPIGVNGETRPSRLMKSKWGYIRRSVGSIARSFFVYKPVRTFLLLGGVAGVAGLVLVVRWIVLSLADVGGTHVPSLVAAAGLLMVAALTAMGGLLAELAAINRRLLQEILYLLRRNDADARAFARRYLVEDEPSDGATESGIPEGGEPGDGASAGDAVAGAAARRRDAGTGGRA